MSRSTSLSSLWPGGIDLKSEQLITLQKANRLAILCPDGRPRHIARLYRFIGPNGCRGIRLGAVRSGGTICTTREEVERFVRRLSDPQAVAPAVNPSERQRNIDHAVAELAAAGI